MRPPRVRRSPRGSGHVGFDAVDTVARKVAFAGERITPVRQCAPRETVRSNLIRERIAQIATRQWPDVGVRAMGRPTRNAATAAAKFWVNWVGHGILDDEAFGGDAALTVVLIAGAHADGRAASRSASQNNETGLSRPAPGPAS